MNISIVLANGQGVNFTKEEAETLYRYLHELFGNEPLFPVGDPVYPPAPNPFTGPVYSEQPTVGPEWTGNGTNKIGSKTS